MPQVSLYALCRSLYLIYCHPLAKYPGPRIAAVTNVWYAYQWYVMSVLYGSKIL